MTHKHSRSQQSAARRLAKDTNAPGEIRLIAAVIAQAEIDARRKDSYGQSAREFLDDVRQRVDSQKYQTGDFHQLIDCTVGMMVKT